MIKQSITFNDLEGNPITREFFFHLSKAELTEMELSANGGLAEHMLSIAKAKNGGEIVREFKKILLAAYGVKDDDGISFNKSPELSRKFEQSDAYSELFMQIATDTDAMIAFFKGVLPKDLAAAMPSNLADIQLKSGVQLPAGEMIAKMMGEQKDWTEKSPLGVVQPDAPRPTQDDRGDVMKYAQARQQAAPPTVSDTAQHYLPPDRGE